MYLKFETINQLVDSLAALPRQPGDQVMLALADCHQPQMQEIVKSCEDAQIPVFGGVFPGLLADCALQQCGAIFQVLPLVHPPLVVDLSHQAVACEQFQSLELEPGNKCTGFMFFDCLAPGTSGFVSEVFDYFGNRACYVGSGAGNGQLSPGACIFANGEVFDNSGLLAFVASASQITTGHGWNRFKGPYLASRCEGNEVVELDWQSAEKVYREGLPDTHRNLSGDDVFARITADFPLGIYMEGSEDIVRDPIARTEQGGLLFVSEIPENSQVYMMHSDAAGLLLAANAVAEQTLAPAGRRATYMFACDCYTRTLFLEHKFQDELDIIWGHPELNVTIEGVIALGEIAGDGETSLQIHNKSIVTGLLYE